ncbi:MAG: hypothetical protein R3Y05_01155 [bacterium]
MKLKEGQEIYLKAKVTRVDKEEPTWPYVFTFENGNTEYFKKNIENHIIPTSAKIAQVQSKWFEVETESANLILINLDKIIVIGQNVAGEYIVELSEHNNFKITKDSYNKLKERLMEE